MVDNQLNLLERLADQLQAELLRSEDYSPSFARPQKTIHRSSHHHGFRLTIPGVRLANMISHAR